MLQLIERLSRLKDDNIEKHHYIVNSLVRHVAAADSYARLVLLFDDHDWMHLRYDEGSYTYDGYLEDLSIALNAAHTLCTRQVDKREVPTAFSDCVHLALVRNVVNGVETDFLQFPDLVAIAIETGFWNVERAVKLLSRRPYMPLGIRLLQFPMVTGLQRLYVQQICLKEAEQESDPEIRALYLIDLYNLIDDEAKTPILEQIHEAISRLWKIERRFYLLVRLLKYLEWQDEHLMQLALQLSKQILFDNHERKRILEDTAMSSSNIEQRVRTLQALIELSEHLPIRTRKHYIEEATEITLSITHEESFLNLLPKLAPHLDRTLLTRCLDAIKIRPHMESEALLALTPYLTGELAASVFQMALKYNSLTRSELLLLLIPNLSDKECQLALDSVFVDIFEKKELRSGRDCALGAKAVKYFEPERSQAILAECIDRAQHLEDLPSRAYRLIELSQVVTTKQRAQLLSTAVETLSQLGGWRTRAQLLQILFHQVPNANLHCQIPPTLFSPDPCNDNIKPLLERALNVLAGKPTNRRVQSDLQHISTITDKKQRLMKLWNMWKDLPGSAFRFQNWGTLEAMYILRTIALEKPGGTEFKLRIHGGISSTPLLNPLPLLGKDTDVVRLQFDEISWFWRWEDGIILASSLAVLLTILPADTKEEALSIVLFQMIKEVIACANAPAPNRLLDFLGIPELISPEILPLSNLETIRKNLTQVFSDWIWR